MDKKQILIGLEHGLMDVHILYQALTHVFDLEYEPSECGSGMEVVTRAMYANHFGRPFELFVLSYFHSAAGRTIHRELEFTEVVGMIRSMRAYEKTPILVVSPWYYDRMYRNLCIRVWVDPHTPAGEWQNAIWAACNRESKNSGDTWHKVLNI